MAEVIDGRFALLDTKPRSGAGGDVYKAVDLQSEGRFVAVKFIKGHPDDPMTNLLFERETVTLSRLQHPNIIEMIDAGRHVESGKYYIVLEWVEQNLGNVFDQPPWEDWSDFARSYALPLADALAYAHLQNVEHRDIKPQNILVSNGIPKLADFGIGKLRDKIEPFGRTLQEWHTPPYCPPDQSLGFEFTRDVWALAVVMISAMSNHPILDYPDIPERLREISVPADVRALLSRCVHAVPAERPQNGPAFYQELLRVQSSIEARYAREQATLAIKLTRRAAEQIREGASVSAEATAASDLTNTAHVEYRYDPKSKKLDRTTIFLYGTRWRFTLKFGDRDPVLIAVGAHPFEAMPLQKARTRSCDIGGQVSINFRKTAPEQAEAGLDFLLDALNAHHDSKEEVRAARDARKEENELFERYLDLLSAREEVAQGERKPLTYLARNIRGREVDFSLRDPLEIELIGEEWDIRFPGGRPLSRGEIIAQSMDSLTIIFRKIPNYIPDNGELSPFLGPSQIANERQLDAVRSIRDGDIPRPILRDLLLRPENIRPPKPVTVSQWQNPHLDAGKRDAVSAALGAKDFLVVEGPPGTGKTSFITELVYQFLNTRPSAQILIVSQTHVAVDNALERIEKAGIDGLVRLGLPEDPRVDPRVRHLLLDQQMTRWAQRIKARADSFITKLATDYELPIHHLRAALVVQRLASVLADIEYLESPGSNSSGDDAEPGAVQDAIELRERLDSLRDQHDQLLAEARGFLQIDFTVPDSLTADDARSLVGALIDVSPNSAHLLSILQLQGEWLQRVASDRKLAGAFLQTVNVVAGTCIGFLGHRAVRDLEFDLCILDEASKATATEALVPLARSKKWVVVGDSRQLPPMDEEILRKPSVMKQYNLDDEFVRTTLFDRLVAGTDTPVRYMLRQQYRMIRPIGDLISTCFYQENLISPMEAGIEGMNYLGKPVLWLDTSKHGAKRAEEAMADGTSFFNRLEAKVAVDRLRIIDAAIDRGLVHVESGRVLSVLLMAPYRRQIEELERQRAAFLPRHLKVQVLSVDAVQGLEADLGIFTVTRSNNRGQLGFLAEPYWRRINVALSRARFSLAVIGDLQFCLSQPGALGRVGRYMREHELDCEVRDAEHV